MGMLTLVGTRKVAGLGARESCGVARPVPGAQYVRVVATLSGG